MASDANLDTAAYLGLATIARDNMPLGRKWNDGFELAGREGVDFVVPCGSDDWIDSDLIAGQILNGTGEIRCSRLSAVVNEAGTRLARLRINYGSTLDFGDGVRVMATSLLEPLGYRPAEEDRKRAIDTSVFVNIRRMLGRQPRVSFTDLHSLQIVDFKSNGQQLNDYAGCLGDRRLGASESRDPWGELAGVYPAEAVDEMRAVYRLPVKAAA